MKDLHSHILPGIDDGSKTMESTKELLLSAHNNGVTDIMFTPHYVEDSKYISNKENNTKIFNEVKKIANEIGINIYLGNEVYINYNLVDLYNKKEITTLNDSKYMLFELPLNAKFNDVKSVCFELLNIGITPILAHPERYGLFYNDIDFFYDLRVKGVLMQINYPSIIGDYGNHAKKMAKKLLKANLISFVGSDVHSINEDKYTYIDKVNKKLTKWVGYEKMLDLTENNFVKVINNEDI